MVKDVLTSDVVRVGKPIGVAVSDYMAKADVAACQINTWQRMMQLARKKILEISMTSGGM